MLRAADVSAEGLEGQLRATGLGAVYGSVFRTWLKDDDPGLARTMAALDRRLRRGEETLNSIDDVREEGVRRGGRLPDCLQARKRAGRAEAGARGSAAGVCLIGAAVTAAPR